MMLAARLCVIITLVSLPMLAADTTEFLSILGQEDIPEEDTPTEEAAPLDSTAQNDEKNTIFRVLTQRLKTVTSKGVVLSEEELGLYASAEMQGKKRNAVTFVTEWKQNVYPDLYLLGAPKSGSTALWACHTSGLFDRDMACRGAMEPCRRPYLWNNKTEINKEFAQMEVLALSGTVSRQYLEYFPKREAPNTYAKTLDGLPRLLAHHSAFAHLFTIAPDRSMLRFVVMVREPVARSFSEWKYFKMLREKKNKFTELVDLPYEEKIQAELDEMLGCWPELESDPVGVLMMPYDKFHPKYRECVEWQVDNHIRTGLYVLALRNWSQFFRIDQFTFLLQEAQVDYGMEDKMQDFADFAGLHLEKDVLEMLVGMKGKTPQGAAPVDGETEEHAAFRSKIEHVYSKCESWDGVSRTSLPEGPVVTRLRAFFKPYNDALAAALPNLNIPWSTQAQM